MDGIDALGRIKDISPGIPVYHHDRLCIGEKQRWKALRSGAYDYLTKPLDIDELKLLVEKALHYHQLKEENRYMKERLDSRFDFSNIIGNQQDPSGVVLKPWP